MKTLVWLAVAGPLFGAVGAWWAPDGESARWLARVTALATAAAWVVVAVGGDVDAGPIAATGLVAPAGVGASLLLAAATRPETRFGSIVGCLVAGAVAAGPAAAAGDGGAPELVLLLAAAVGLSLVAAREEAGVVWPGLAAALGLALVAEALAEVMVDSGSLDLPAGPLGVANGLALVGGGALVAAAGAVQPRRAPAPLLAGGLALAVPGAGLLERGGDAVAVVLAATAVVVLARWPDPRARPLAIGLVAVAAAALPAGARPAALLLAAAAVLAAVALHPVAAVSAVPGAAALAVAVVDDPTGARLAFGVLAALVAVLLAQRPGRVDDGPAPTVTVAAAVVVGGWLLLAPTTWRWAGPPDVPAWTGGAVLAAAAAAAGLAVAFATHTYAVPARRAFGGGDPAPHGEPHRAPRWATRGTLALLGITLVALVLSAVRAS